MQHSLLDSVDRLCLLTVEKQLDNFQVPSILPGPLNFLDFSSICEEDHLAEFSLTSRFSSLEANTFL